MTQVILARLYDMMPHKQRLLSALPESYQKKALRYVQEKDQVRSAVGSLLIARFVSLESIKIGARGKPYAPDGPCFNISHAGDYIGIIVGDDDVGIDIEEVSRCNLGIVKAAFTDEEALLIRDCHDLAKAWTIKEAVGKCLGEGLLMPRENGVKLDMEGRCIYKEKTFYLRCFEHLGHAFAFAKRSPFDELTIDVIGVDGLLQ